MTLDAGSLNEINVLFDPAPPGAEKTGFKVFGGILYRKSYDSFWVEFFILALAGDLGKAVGSRVDRRSSPHNISY